MSEPKIVRLSIDLEKEIEPTEVSILTDRLRELESTNNLRESMGEWGPDSINMVLKRARKDMKLGLGINHPVIISLINNAMRVYAEFTDEFKRLNKKDHDLLVDWKKPSVFIKVLKKIEEENIR